jgi:hypothetical protein
MRAAISFNLTGIEQRFSPNVWQIFLRIRFPRELSSSGKWQALDIESIAYHEHPSIPLVETKHGSVPLSGSGSGSDDRA